MTEVSEVIFNAENTSLLDLLQEEPVLTVRENNVSEESVSTPPSKKMKLESSHSPFILENDKLTKSLLDLFPFPDNFTPEISLAMRNQMMPPRVLDKFITAIERWVFLRASYGSPYVCCFFYFCLSTFNLIARAIYFLVSKVVSRNFAEHLAT